MPLPSASEPQALWQSSPSVMGMAGGGRVPMGMWVNRKGDRMEWPRQGIGDRVGPLSELSESQLHWLVS